MSDTAAGSRNFIEEIIDNDIAAGRVADGIRTRFPPEPNGYLHIGHLKALVIDFSMAQKYGGVCNLRFDDTNPAKEDVEYVEAIKDNIRALGFEWDKLCFGSDYFDECYKLAVKLIEKGAAYVCDLSQAQMREYRGTLTAPGKNSPWRERSVAENLDLFERMRAGEFADGARVLRAKIDMASPNINMRDPALYRILHRHHHQSGDKWCIYPMYDFAHPIQDAIEGITHSLCSLEYEAHRPLYDWVVEQCEFEHRPRQIEFARLNITRTVLSKRYLRQLVESGLVSGWDDPRMPTLVGLFRRGYTAHSLREFIRRIGVAKADSIVDIAFLEHCVREDLNETAARAMAVLRPLKITLTNWPQGHVEEIEIENHPAHPEMGTRCVPLSGRIFIERDDFMEDPPKKFFRLFPGGEVRLKGAYIIKCDGVERGEDGEVTGLLCSVDFNSRSGTEGGQRKVKGTLHWVDGDAPEAQVRLYDYLLADEAAQDAGDDEDEEESDKPHKDFAAMFNAESIEVLEGCRIERSLASCAAGERFQFMRQGYFICDPDPDGGRKVFNRIVGLKDSWAKAGGKA